MKTYDFSVGWSDIPANELFQIYRPTSETSRMKIGEMFDSQHQIVGFVSGTHSDQTKVVLHRKAAQNENVI